MRNLPPAPPAWSAHRRFDGEGRGCGELLLALRLDQAPLPPGTPTVVIADDEGAPIEMPAWCRLTGHRLLGAAHPHYLIERRP